MARDTTGRIKVVRKIDNVNTRETKAIDGRQVVIIWDADKEIRLCQMDDGNRTSCPSVMTMETVEPSEIDRYLASMLANGWSWHEGVYQGVG